MGGDIPALFRDFGIIIVNAFDTQEASGFLGRTGVGLAALLDLWGCPLRRELAALKDKMKNTDWRLRPMNEIMLQYATLDVHYLISLYKLQVRELLLSPSYNDDEYTENENENENEINDDTNDDKNNNDNDNEDNNNDNNNHNNDINKCNDINNNNNNNNNCNDNINNNIKKIYVNKTTIKVGSYQKKKLLKNMEKLNCENKTSCNWEDKKLKDEKKIEYVKKGESWSEKEKEEWKEKQRKKSAENCNESDHDDNQSDDKYTSDKNDKNRMKNDNKNDNKNQGAGKLQVRGLEVTDDSLAVHFNRNNNKSNNNNNSNNKSISNNNSKSYNKVKNNDNNKISLKHTDLTVTFTEKNKNDNKNINDNVDDNNNDDDDDEDEEGQVVWGLEPSPDIAEKNKYLATSTSTSGLGAYKNSLSDRFDDEGNGDDDDDEIEGGEEGQVYIFYTYFLLSCSMFRYYKF